MPFVVDMSMCFFFFGPWDPGLRNFKTSPMESIIFGWVWYVFTLGYVKIAIETAIDIVTIVDFPIENGDFP